MTSQKSLKNNVNIKDLKRSFIDSLAFPLIAFGVLFFLVTVGVIGYFTSERFAFSKTDWLYYFIASNTLFYDAFSILPMGMVLCGMLTAFKSFYFVLSRKQVNVYFSLGLKRATIFKNRLIAGASNLFLSVFIPITIILLVNIAYLGASAQLFKVYFYFVFALFTCAMVGFSMASLTIAVTGNIVEAVGTCGVLSFLPMVCTYLVITIRNAFLKGNIFESDISSYGELLSPWMFVRSTESQVNNTGYYDRNYVSVSKLISGFDKLSVADGKLPEAYYVDSTFIAPVLGWAIATVVLLVIGYFLFKRRKAENSNSIGKFAISRAIISTLAFAVVSLICTEFLNEYYGVAVTTLLALAGATVAFFIVQLILTRKIKVALKSMAVCSVWAVALISVTTFFGTECFGTYNKLPEKEKIKSVSISISASVGNSTPMFGDYISSANPDDIDMVIDLFEKTRKDTGKYNEEITWIYFEVVDENGKKMNRVFDVWSAELYSYYLETTTNSDFFDALLEEELIGYGDDNKSENGLYTLNRTDDYNEYDKITEDLVFSFNLYDTQMIVPVIEDKERDYEIAKGDALAVALYNDLSKMTYDQIYRNNNKPYVVLGFENQYITDVNQKYSLRDYTGRYDMPEQVGTNYYVSPIVCVYPEMTETMSVIEAEGYEISVRYEGKIKQILYTDAPISIFEALYRYKLENEKDYNSTVTYKYVLRNDFTSAKRHTFDSQDCIYLDASIIDFIDEDTTNLQMLNTVYSDIGHPLTVLDESKYDSVIAKCLPEYNTYNNNGRYVFIIYEDGSIVAHYIPEVNIGVLK